LLSGKFAQDGIDGRLIGDFGHLAGGTHHLVGHDVCAIGHIAPGRAGTFAGPGGVAVAGSVDDQRAACVCMITFAPHAVFTLHITSAVAAVARAQCIDIFARCVPRCTFAAENAAVRHHNSF
jgi:hypothetical protein